MASTTERIHKRVNELKAEKIEACRYVVDLMNREQTQKFVSAVLDNFGRVDILINNAGMAQVGSPEKFIPFTEIEDEEWDLSISRILPHALM
ncbi:SDR family NAD(P)-dependent oxidoreductase [Aneurinibacillus migulanus]|uniref:SDR family NAD(P)-dependent oxidoreductase n=1 Tax=Aneurinibacillus migulanus TaxID=47500 RepID=UPI00190FE031|nr:SDR family NAD(P)-dependent oxidoreductase [Aneurinibacillus migulanus]MED4727189.1 SDR family NAD(P)-dependent oxidoreductase [Aneurinibacillus migulanus]